MKDLNFDGVKFIDFFPFYSLCLLCHTSEIFAKLKVTKIFPYIFFEKF